MDPPGDAAGTFRGGRGAAPRAPPRYIPRVLAAAVIIVSLFAAPDGDPQEQVRRIAEREGLQTSLAFDPKESASRPAEGATRVPPGRTSEGRPRAAPRREPRETRGSGSSGAPWAKTLIFLLGAALLVALIVGVVVALRRPPAGSTASGTAPPPTEPAAGLPLAALGPAEALAAEGRFAEAVHRLLIDALAFLAARASHSIPRSWTSREILGALRLLPAAREALRELVDAVEISRFGGRPVGEADWRRAHAAFTGLAPKQDAAGHAAGRA